MNNFHYEKKGISDKVELEKIKQRLEQIYNNRESLQTKDEKLLYDFKTQEEYNELMVLIQRGIIINDIPYKKEITDKLVLFFSNFGISRHEIISRIDELEFFVSDISIGYHGKLVHTCNRVGIDISYIDSFENGSVSFKPEVENLIIHALTHEFLHKLSSEEAGKEVIVMEDGIIEGYTDMFAHLVSGKVDIVSQLYSFPEKVCMLFTEMMGMEKAVHDYMYNNQNHPNLHQLFIDCGCEDFLMFRASLSKVITQTVNDKKKGKTECLALGEKIACLDFICNNILSTYCNQNVENAPKILGLFNSLFSEYGYNFEIEERKVDIK